MSSGWGSPWVRVVELLAADCSRFLAVGQSMVGGPSPRVKPGCVDCYRCFVPLFGCLCIIDKEKKRDEGMYDNII